MPDQFPVSAAFVPNGIRAAEDKRCREACRQKNGAGARKDDVVFSEEDRKILLAFTEKYDVKFDFDPSGVISRDDLDDFAEELEEISEDIEEAIEEIGEKEKENDVADLIEELADLIKDCLWK